MGRGRDLLFAASLIFDCAIGCDCGTGRRERINVPLAAGRRRPSGRPASDAISSSPRGRVAPARISPATPVSTRATSSSTSSPPTTKPPPLPESAQLSGEYPKRNLSAEWIGRHLARLGLEVRSSTLFPVEHSYEDMARTVGEAREWIDELELGDATEDVRRSYREVLIGLEEGVEGATEDGPVFAGEHTYVVAAGYPRPGATRSEVVMPTAYRLKQYYRRDKDPVPEGLSSGPLAPGVMEEYSWANGDPYDGFSARIGVPPGLGPALTEYVKGLGLWDLMIDTIYDNPMEPDETRFYNLTSPFGEGGRNFTWSAKRPGNFYGSDVSHVACNRSRTGFLYILDRLILFGTHPSSFRYVIMQSRTCTGLTLPTRRLTRIRSGHWPREGLTRC